MISFYEALKIALRRRDELTRMIRFRYDTAVAWQGSLSNSEHALLKRAVLEVANHPGPIIEIGTLFGFTTAMIASWAGAQQRIITVDNFSWNPWGVSPDVQRALAQRILAPFLQNGQVEICEMASIAFFESYQGPPPALVFIDGDHSYTTVHSDIAGALRLGAKIIGGHDYSPSIPGVVQAVEEYFPQQTIRQETLWIYGGTTINVEALDCPE